MDGIGVGMAIAAILVTGWMLKIDQPQAGTNDATAPAVRNGHRSRSKRRRGQAHARAAVRIGSSSFQTKPCESVARTRR